MIRQTGFTYLEIVIVVIILGIVAAAAMPMLSSSDTTKLDAAASEIAEAVDFARTEAIRTKITHGINTDASLDQVRVYSKPSTTAVYDVYHPIDKKLYVLQLKNNTQTSGVDLVSASFTFSNGVSNGLLDFNSDGMPKYSSTTDYMLTSGSITLSYKSQLRKVIIAPMTGRVTIQ
jgi:prepilin-type N-terminal cleavage/methylation domain-containing protein